ncbi:aminopeptidase P family protein [Candidatus Thorarchaeota archaeon]|nr:MAG: aminopeptidase P family protein [Candidatus Thorarchaeota archaeon]
MYTKVKERLGCESKTMLDESVYHERMDKIHQKLNESGADFALLTPAPNFQYLAGYQYQMHERLVALFIRRGAEPTIVVPSFEESDHKRKTWIKDFISWGEEEDPYSLIADSLGSSNKEVSVLLDDNLPLGVYWKLEKAFSRFNNVQSITPTINKLRISKSTSETSLMKKAGHIIDDAVMKAFSAARIGMTELEVKQIVENEIIRQGATPTFAAIQFGENSALPHAGPSTRELKRDDVVLMDCGCAVDGYNTDMTRVGVAGNPTEEVTRVYSIVLRAEESAIEKISMGMNCGTADGIARRIIEDEGYGDNFTHRLGHGIGLEVHEDPYLVRGSTELLGEGMCHSIEPGIYLEGKFGIRIEDLVCVHEAGPEILTFSPRALIIMDV